MVLNVYSKKQRWKFLLFITAVIIGVSSLLYTNKLVKSLSAEERKKVELWAKASKQFAESGISDKNIKFLFEVIRNNETVPVILVDLKGKIISKRNLDPLKQDNEEYLQHQLEIMKSQHEPIEISLSNEDKNYIYYKDSILLTKLLYYPYIQLGVIFLFILVSYFAFSYSWKAEQNQVWVGMSKETAHQLGTPISSLMAWIELLKDKNIDKNMVLEFEKDVSHLKKITERFSKIGSKPTLTKLNIIEVLTNALKYIKTRSSENVVYKTNFSGQGEILVPLNMELFEWVIENLCKNAIDAMEGSGIIDISVSDNVQFIYIDIKDTGKGIPKSKYKTVFQPGYTTNPRGWGLGLSLTKRIIEIYHSGKIFVSSSEINKGTAFRIVLKK